MMKRKQRFAEWLLFAGFWVFLILGLDSGSRWALPFTLAALFLALAYITLCFLRFVRGDDGP